MIKKNANFFISLCCILLAAAIHVYARLVSLPFHSNSLILGLYSLAIVFWMQKNQRMILHQEVRRYLLYIGHLLLAYLFVRTVKYDLTVAGSSLERYLWYVYYIILMAIGVFLLFSVLYMDKGRHEKIGGKWSLVYVLLFIFSVLFISNDLHQMIFTFPLGLSNWSDSSNGYGPLFSLLLVYCGAIVLVTFFISTKKLLDRRNVKNIFVTLAVPLVWALYTYFYLRRTDYFSWFFVAFKSPEFNTLVTMAYIESLIYNRLIPTNLDYEKFWDLSSLDIGLMTGNGVFHSKNPSLDLDRSLIQRAEVYPLFLDETTLLESAKVSQGYSYWLTDLSPIHAIREELKNFGDLIAEENELLKAKNQLKKDQASLKRQMEICEFIEGALEDKVLHLEECLGDLGHSEEAFTEGMRLATLVQVYIKRFSNMLLLSQKSRVSSLVELKLAMVESLNYLEIFGVDSHLVWEAEGVLDLDNMLLVYKTFEGVLEGNIRTLEAVLVRLELRERDLVLSMEIENPDPTYEGSRFLGRDFSCQDFVEEGTLYLRAKLFLGGDPDDLR
ncbi:MAG: hypothetical protein Q4E37_04655 [Tissierellia bacterium]|nr:hypothetical protein [Tissierellia bacterium]